MNKIFGLFACVILAISCNNPNKEAKIIVFSIKQKAIEFLWKQILRQENKTSKEENPTLGLVNSISYFPCYIDEIDIDFVGNSM